jgi:mono/diheme cytochrome c family protein
VTGELPFSVNRAPSATAPIRAKQRLAHLYMEFSVKVGRSDEAVRQVIANGKGTMPAFKEKLDPHQIDDLLEYLRTL